MARRPYRPRRLRLAIKEQMAVRGISSVVALHALLRRDRREHFAFAIDAHRQQRSELLNLSGMNG